MKKIIILIVLTFSYSAMSQSLSVFDVDASNFPKIKANFFAFDKDGKQLTNLNPSDFEVKENGLPRTVTNVTCPPPQPPIALSSVLVFDVSGSMSGGPPRIQSAKNAANAWIDGLPLGKSECALVSFNENSYIIQDFTTSRDKLKVAINKLNPDGGTDYDQALIDLPAGGLQIAKNGKYKKVVIFLTDGLSQNTPNVNKIIKFAKDNQITIYAVTLDMPAPQSIKDMTTQTGGQYFENITTQKEAEETYRKLLQLAQGDDTCEIQWQSGVSCFTGIINVQIESTNLGINANTSYEIPNTSIANLEFNPPTIKFINPEIGVKAEQKVILTAHNADFNVTNISCNNSEFSITPINFILKKGESIELAVSYLPADNSYVFARFDVENNICQTKYYAIGSFSGMKPNKKTLKLIHPNGGEVFVAGNDTLITWEGISESDTVQLEYSIDNGLSWKTLTDNASGLLYEWKNIPTPPSVQCKVRIKQITKQYVNVSPGKLLHTLSGFKNFIRPVSWSPDGSRIATTSRTSLITRIFASETGDLIYKLSGNTCSVEDVNWSPDGTRFVTANQYRNAIIWDINKGDTIQILDVYNTLALAVSWNPDGSRVATANGDKTIRIWDAKSGTSLLTLNGHTKNANSVRWSPDGSRLATAGKDSTARIWDADNGDLLHTLNGHKDNVISVRWDPTGSRVATVSYDLTARI